MPKNVLIVGDWSYLADGIDGRLFPLNVERVHYLDDIPRNSIKKFDTVINFGIQPDFSKRILWVNELIDVQLANVLQWTDTKLIMLSSRKVYWSHKNLDILKESDQLSPTDFYSANKIKAEEELNNILPNQHLTLRIANILWLPTNRIWYKTFIGWISDSMRDKWHLYITENPDTRKDFISKEYFQNTLSELVKQDVIWTINLWSWFAMSLKELLWHICWEENLIFADDLPEPRDQFILDNEKLLQYVKWFTYDELIQRCEENKQIILSQSEWSKKWKR